MHNENLAAVIKDDIINIMKHSPSQIQAVEGGGLDVDHADNEGSPKDA